MRVDRMYMQHHADSCITDQDACNANQCSASCWDVCWAAPNGASPAVSSSHLGPRWGLVCLKITDDRSLCAVAYAQQLGYVTTGIRVSSHAPSTVSKHRVHDAHEALG